MDSLKDSLAKTASSPTHPSGNGEFDPLRDLFIAQAHRPANVGEINLRTLSPFQRTLLVIDGTVTKFIEAYTMEPVEIVLLSHENHQLSEDHAWLEATSGTSVISRQVLLRGKYSYTLHAYAASLIIQERLPDFKKDDLETSNFGLGRMLLQSQLETRREVLWYGRESADQLPAAVRQIRDGAYITRTYRIITGGQPAMLINEKFPYGVDQLPSHH